jgi:hypothetical protein
MILSCTQQGEIGQLAEREHKNLKIKVWKQKKVIVGNWTLLEGVIPLNFQ